MIYTAQEMAAQIKAWEYYVAILFLVVLIAFWRLLGREWRARRKAQPAGHAPQPGGGDHLVAGGDMSQLSTSRPPRAQELKAECAQYAGSPFPCWLARQLTSREEDRGCASCHVFAQAIEQLTEAAKQQPTASTVSKPSAPN